MTYSYLQERYACLFEPRKDVAPSATKTIIVTLPHYIKAEWVISGLTSCDDHELVKRLRELGRDLNARFHFVGDGLCGRYGASTVNVDQVAIEVPADTRKNAEQRLASIQGLTLVPQGS